MKLRFNNLDIQCAVKELQKLIGSRIHQIYDVDNKTFLFRFQGAETKTTVLLESGIRFHSTSFEWPKNNSPSGFTMKLRKHLKNKRLEKLEQMGTDRVVKFVFGSNEAMYCVILELYDRGNIILTDYENTILNLIRPHVEGEDIRLAVKEKYPENRVLQKNFDLTEEAVKKSLEETQCDNLKGFLMGILDCGATAIDHVLKRYNLEYCSLQTDSKPTKPQKSKKKTKNESNLRKFNEAEDFENLMKAILEANEICNEVKSTSVKGYIIQKKEEKLSLDGTKDYFLYNIEYHPYLFDQHKDMPFATFNTFLEAVDEFYSSLESQKIDSKTNQLEKEALKKLLNVKIDHEKRIDNLAKVQEMDKIKADLIRNNLNLVDAAINAVRQLLANQMSWANINLTVKAAQEKGDSIAKIIQRLKLETNVISLILKHPPEDSEEDEDEDDDDLVPEKPTKEEFSVVDVDINLSAWGNANKYFDQKRVAAQKEQKTIDASEKALKNAEKKTHQTLKDVRTISNITKARKTFWFEKFYWFISSENYLVIGGRDAQQNELIVKRYMRPNDIYVHAEIQGASSVVIRNPVGGDVPPKTLQEAGTMAISYSVAWDAKVVTNAYWVNSSQVSKTAPSGEYLSSGSFMIRGKKNFLPPCQLIMGVSVLFKLEDDFIKRHAGERRVKTSGDDFIASESASTTENSNNAENIETKDVVNDTEPAEISEDDHLKNSETIDFPDSEIKVVHGIDGVSLLKEENIIAEMVNDPSLPNNSNIASEETSIINCAPARKKQATTKQKKAAKDASSKKQVQIQIQNETPETDTKNNSQMKRGKKNKQKRQNSKYKDQDNEERELRMQILKSAGKFDLKSDNDNGNSLKTERSEAASIEKQRVKVIAEFNSNDDTKLAADVDMLEALTGQPFEDDELLFAIPVVAPYQALQSYKYKIKIIPGTGKRGAAAKNTLALFSKDKNCSKREKDLFKSLKDEMLARNIPGKVKLMASNLHKHKS